MNRVIHLLILVALLAGCATGGSGEMGYYSTYEVNGSDGLSGAAAEVALASAAEAARVNSGVPPFDQPLQLLRAPQPVMSRDDIEHNATGEMVVRILFSELGSVERTTILKSTKESLSEAVLAAVQLWRIAPATRGGTPQKVTAHQTFRFKTGQ